MPSELPNEESTWLMFNPTLCSPWTQTADSPAARLVHAGCTRPMFQFRSGAYFWSKSPSCPHFAYLGSYHRVVSFPDLDSIWMKPNWEMCSSSSPNRLWCLVGHQFMGVDYKLFWNKPFFLSCSLHCPKVSQTFDAWHQLLHATELLLANTGVAIVYCFSSYVNHKLTHTLWFVLCVCGLLFFFFPLACKCLLPIQPNIP